FVQVGDGTVNDLGAGGGVDFEIEVSGLGAGWHGAKREAGDSGRSAGFDFHFADGDGFAVVFPDHEFKALRVGFKDLQQDKTTGHAAEAHLLVEGTGGVVGTEILFFSGAVAAIKSVQPGLKGVARGRIGD